MNKKLLLLAVLLINPGVPSTASDTAELTFETLADKCFTGYTDFAGRRSSLEACFNAKGTHAFYRENRYNPEGPPQSIYFDTSVELAGGAKILLPDYEQGGEMTVSGLGGDQMRIKGHFTYDGEYTHASVSLKEASPERTRELQQQILYH